MCDCVCVCVYFIVEVRALERIFAHISSSFAGLLRPPRYRALYTENMKISTSQEKHLRIVYFRSRGIESNKKQNHSAVQGQTCGQNFVKIGLEKCCKNLVIWMRLLYFQSGTHLLFAALVHTEIDHTVIVCIPCAGRERSRSDCSLSSRRPNAIC